MPLNSPPFMRWLFAENGDRADIPVTNNQATGRASQEYGFPPITSQPIAAGGIPPTRDDVNGVLYQNSQFNYWQQNGGPFYWEADKHGLLDFVVNCRIFGSDGKEYIATQPSGPSYGGPQDPVSSPDYWRLYITEPSTGILRDVVAGTIHAWPSVTVPTLDDGLPLGLILDGSIVDLTIYPRLARALCANGVNAWYPAWYRCNALGQRGVNPDVFTYIKLDDWRGGTPRALDMGRAIDKSLFLANTTAGSSQITMINNLSGGGTLSAPRVNMEGVYPGITVGGTGIPAGTTIVSVSGSTITLSAGATNTATSVLLVLTGRIPGSWQSDTMRSITGSFGTSSLPVWAPSGAFSLGPEYVGNGSATSPNIYVNFDNARVTPIAPNNRPAGPAALFIIRV